MARFIVTARAKLDVDALARWSVEKWGALKTADYMSSLYERFQWLAENPKVGRIREEIGTSFRSYLQGSHLIFYRLTEDGVEIIGVPHASMDFGSHFN